MSSSNIQSDESQSESFITDRSHVSSFERAASEPGNQGSELQLLGDMHNGLLTNSAQQCSDNHSLRTLKTRKRFGPDEDLLLVKVVNWILPYCQGRNKLNKAWQGIAERLNKLSSFNLESVNSKSCQNGFNMLLARHRMQEAESTIASSIDEEYTEFRGLMDGIMSDFNEWESEKHAWEREDYEGIRYKRLRWGCCSRDGDAASERTASSGCDTTSRY
ncbi:unnamed protein product [Phytophthora fragariaefolia]|uniref:Unnamed protein product n=1 Tax=Phytophthora fragariaefolia TaxID=1490495 RepID=A0A9W6X873_9STRA|nr:unnamed protein product [Phytophthora fragariaefolia]